MDSSRAFVSPVALRNPRISRRASVCRARCAVQARSTRLRASISTPADGVGVGFDFDARESTRDLALCLVGMSNCGKSHWSSRLAEDRGFALYCVDERIEKAIEPELTALGFAGIDGMAEWMGFPSDERFGANQRRYLELEEQLTREAVEGRPLSSKRSNVVLDTTGSVVYLSKATLKSLRESYLVVHLEASDDMLESMTDNYFLTPKPVVWGDCFTQNTGETATQALRRCYPKLLRERRAMYSNLAHVTIPASFALSKHVTSDQFVDRLCGELSGTSKVPADGVSN